MPEETIHPVYLVKGKEPVLRAEAVTGLLDRLTDPAFRDFDVDRLDGRSATLDQVLAAAAGIPFASERKVTLIEDAQRLNPDLFNPDLKRPLQKLLPAHMGERATLIFVAGEAGDGERTQGVTRRLDSLAKSMGKVISCDPLKGGEAAAWLVGAAKRHGLSLDGGARTELIARVGPNLGALEREIEKLGAYIGERTTATREDVVAVVPESAEYSVFTLVDAVSEGRVALALNTLHGLRARNEPAQRIMALLARQLRLVWQAKMLLEDPANADRLPDEPDFQKLAPFIKEKARRQARGLSWDRLRQGFRLLLDKDLALKGIEGPPTTDDEALETLIFALCRK